MGFGHEPLICQKFAGLGLRLNGFVHEGVTLLRGLGPS